MATFNDLAVLIAEPLGREMDSAFTAMLKARIKYWRAKLLRDTLNKNPQERQFFTQRITVKLTETPAADCGLNVSCNMMVSETIPDVVRANNIVYDFVGSVDGTNAFKMVKRWELPYILQNRYLPLVAEVYARENSKILLPGNSLTPFISIEAVFADPEAAFQLNCGNGGCASDCSFEEVEYPVSEDIAQQIVQYILQVDFNRQPSENKEEIDVDDDSKGNKA